VAQKSTTAYFFEPPCSFEMNWCTWVAKLGTRAERTALYLLAVFFIVFNGENGFEL